MAAEYETLLDCCPATARWMEDVLTARCAQIAERGEHAPEECR